MNEGLVAKTLWTAEDAALAVAGRLQGRDSWIATGVSIDTRSLEPGDLFIALKAERDGHDFLADAFAKGAAAALVSDAAPGDAGALLVSDAAPGDAGALLVVDDTFTALQALGRAGRARGQARVCAITGSVGKTSVKEALAACLAPSGPTHFAVKSFNNHLGVPLTLARMPPEDAFAVVEIGMNNKGEIAPLAGLAQPHVAIVTTIAGVHLETLGSLEAIAEEKSDIFAGLTRDGVALIPADAPHADILLAKARAHAAAVALFGRGAECDARLISFDPGPDGSVVEADILGKPVSYRVGAPGTPWALNSLCVLAAAALMGGDFEPALEALARLQPAPGRGRAVDVALPGGGRFTLVDDAYNASPVSVAAALETLGRRTPGPGGRRIAALGDMLELGPAEAELHAGLASPIAAHGVDLVFCAGPRMRHLFDALDGARRGVHAESAAALAPEVAGAVRPGDVVMVKGSNGSRMALVAEALQALGKAN
jgi:UDP-N-acetylmuramoyl-tripeptide--D-alanyl-D-alanine ligase